MLETGIQMASLVLLALVLGAGVGGGLLTTWSVHRRTLRLQYRVQDLEDRLLTVSQREKAKTRWAKEPDLEEFRKSMQEAPVTKRRFDNDPVETGL